MNWVTAFTNVERWNKAIRPSLNEKTWDSVPVVLAYLNSRKRPPSVLPDICPRKKVMRRGAQLSDDQQPGPFVLRKPQEPQGRRQERQGL